jgi:dihydrofolate reductase
MSAIVLVMSVSLDGYMEGPNREIDWHHVDDELHQHMNDFLGPMAAFLEGRVTYELMASSWPTADEDPASPPVIKEFARIWRDMPKVVYSTTLQRADGKTTIVRDIVPADVLAMKSEASADLVVGGADVAAQFLRHDLIDEFRIYVHPVVLGAGKPLFPGGVRRDLELIESHVFGNGVVLLRYSR